jgi:tetratricopeptide (TPR) repeat protein
MKFSSHPPGWCIQYFFSPGLQVWLGLLTLVLALAPPLYGGGGRDSDLKEADKLIAARQFDKAIQILTEYAEENPNKFFQAQKRLRKIILHREGYNALARQLLDVLTTDPDNSEMILDLTRRLEAQEPSQGMVRQFIAQVRELALFGYNRRLLEQIMIQGRLLLDQGNYIAALNCYAGGLDIYREDFFAAGFGELINNRVSNSLSILMDSITAFSGLVAPFNNAIAGIDRVGNLDGGDSLSRLRDFYIRLTPLMERLIILNNKIAEVGNYFDTQLAQFRQEDPNLGDRNYLSFASRIVYGRYGMDIQEGLLGSVAGLWISVLSQFDKVLGDNTEQSYKNAYAALEKQNFPQARAQFESVIAYCTMALDFLEDWTRFYRGQDVQTYEYFNDIVIASKAGEYLRYMSLNLASASLMEIGPLMEQYSRLSSIHSTTMESWQRGAISTAVAMSREADMRSTYHELAVRVGTVLEKLDMNRTALRGYQFRLTGEGLYYASMDNALTLFKDLDTNIFNLEMASAIREYTIGNGDLQRRFTGWQNLFNDANRLFEGSPVSGADGDYLAKYPAEALSIFVRLDQGTAQGLADGNALITRYDDESPRFITTPYISGLSRDARTLVARIEELRGKTLALAEISRTQSAQAESLRLEGDRFYQEARSALTQSNFDVARDRVLRSGERYDASLVIQESADLRRTRDTNLVALGAEITRLENEAIVREVRNLVNTARDTYFDGNFTQAEEYLVRAVNRWRRTNVEDDPELNYWLMVVRGAMSLQAGRTIPVTAPLYAEMSQILSDAKKNFDDGLRLINENRRPEGIAKFADARQKTREVRLMFPVNQEASLLELRMDQVTDPNAFNTSFQRRLSEAVSGTKRGSVESFADLQNLAAINPAYPGIRDMVAQAEIDMGYRLPPPDERSLARSAELTAAARSIVDRNIRSQFPIALEQLNQALVLNPTNSQAMSLKDRVQTELGGGSSLVLSSTVEREYQRAVQALQQGNTLVAITIVRQLLEDPKNRINRILDLQRRIESLL